MLLSSVCEAWPFRRFFEVGYCFWSRCCCSTEKKMRPRAELMAKRGPQFLIFFFFFVRCEILLRFPEPTQKKKRNVLVVVSVVWLFRVVFSGLTVNVNVRGGCILSVGLVIWPFGHFNSGQLVCRHHLLYDLMYVAVRPVVTTPIILALATSAPQWERIRVCTALIYAPTSALKVIS